MSDDAIPEADRAEGAPHPRESLRLIGQDAAEAAILDALAERRVHHAWLLTGPEGVGKATLAWRMARYLLATPSDGGNTGLFGDAPPPPESLDIDPEHPVARRILALSEPRLTLLRRSWDADKKRLRQQIGVDDVRKLKSFFTLSAAEGGRRLAIIDSADDLNVAAANALLKMLEEPPKDAVLILVSHRPARLLPTIRSRCRTVRLGELAPDALAEVVEASGGSTHDLDALAALSGGSAGEALRLEALGGAALYAALVDLAGGAPRMDRPRALALIDQLTARGAEERRELFVRLYGLFVARLARYGAGAAPDREAAPGEREVLAKLAPDAHAAREWAHLQQSTASRAEHARAVNLDPHQTLLDMLLKLDETAGRLAPAPQI